MSPHKVEIVKVPATTFAVVRFHVGSEELSTIGERMGRAFGIVMSGLGEAHVTPNGPALAYYEPAVDGFDVAAGFRVPATFTARPGLERLDLDEMEAAHTTHIGSYSELPAAYEDLQTQADGADRTLETDGPMWEEYWSEPGTPENETRTEVYWPVSAAG